MIAARDIEQKICDWYLRLAKKYEYAARYPWLPVEPDPEYPFTGK